MLTSSLVFIVLSTISLTLVNADPSLNRFRGHVIKNEEKYDVFTTLASSYQEPDVKADVVASGFWDQTYNTTGWSVLEIKTSGTYSNMAQAYSAGLLEGQFTRELTSWQWQNNIREIHDNAKLREKLQPFFDIQLDWIYDQIDSFSNDPYWHHIQLLLVQLNGLIDGYENVQGMPRTRINDTFGFFLFQVVESIGELAERFKVDGIERHDSCSALVKILPNNSDIFVSHADWSHYKTMLKVIKRYIMPLTLSPAADNSLIPGSDTIFSSYPGTLHSVDDFYMTHPANMTIIETTIVNYNPDLYDNIVPISVPEWMRIVVANRLSDNSQDWIKNFFVFNDGTYNNEWMIADFKKFTPGTPPQAGFLTVAEQMVTYYQTKDLTDILNTDQYWASYNNVYFPDFRNFSREDDQVKDKGPELYSWHDSSRAKIFRRDHNKVKNITSMVYMMRYNDFEHDEYSRCNCTPAYSAELTIAARCDLNNVTGIYPDEPLGHRPHGATDVKITNFEMMQKFELVAIAGPTNQGQPPFVWSQSDFNTNFSHIGHPDVWNFTEFTPVWILS